MQQYSARFNIIKALIFRRDYFRSANEPRIKDLTKHLRPSALSLSDIQDNPGARKKEVRLGRGRGSGCGKTSGRGQKGQRARNSVRLGFEGGQTPLQKRFPKVRTYDPFAKDIIDVTLGRIQRFVDTGRLDANAEIGLKQLVDSGCVRRIKDGLRLVEGGPGSCSSLRVRVTECSPVAAERVVEKGGQVCLAWYNKLGIRATVKPFKWTDQGLPLPRFARPPPKVEHRYPDRDDDGVPIRILKHRKDIEVMTNEWPRPVHQREAKARY
ncbi:50S ribosomal protein L15 [Gracilariopsis chorda]|uniref:50S ribosomal protein L15 n=1 Tax=Gracilariopsis chorda TaxID=448386 RepID=A0A2V3IMQ0_9FLOR|nr:50S ribosomal protein L15 [Gracilariopsis chorda]|eukprot:PXF43361.1 50S ribosomal protein L15 [Gracilariopsis chorda]